MADILATWLNEEVGLSKVTIPQPNFFRKLRALSRILRAATCLESYSTSSISKVISNYFRISKSHRFVTLPVEISIPTA
jgi:hypothetical protein